MSSENNYSKLIGFVVVLAVVVACFFVIGAGWACDRGDGVLNFGDGFKCVGMEKVVACEQGGNLFVLPEGGFNASVG